MKIDERLVESLDLSRSHIRKASDLSLLERIKIAQALRYLDDEELLRLGSLLVKDPDPEVRSEVVLGLGECGYRVLARDVERLASKTIEYLGQLAHDSEWQVRVNVPFAALQCGSAAVLPIVHGLLHDNASQVRKAATSCYQNLAVLYPNVAAKLEVEPLDEPRAIVGNAVAPSLGRFWTPRIEIHRYTTGMSDVDGKEYTGGKRIVVKRYGVGNRRLDPNKGFAFVVDMDKEFGGRVGSRAGEPVERESKAASAEAGSTAEVAPTASEPLVEAPAKLGFGPPEGGGGDGGGGGGEPPRGGPPGGGDGGGGEGQPPEGGPPDDEPEYLDIGGRSRYVNSWFVGHADPLKPLEFGREYELGIEVAPKVRVGTFTRDDLEFREPDFEGQDTLEVTVGIVSDDFTIHGKAAKRMTLPRDPSKRSSEVSFKVTPVKNNRDVLIHVFFYHRNNLFRESLIGAHVQVLKPQPGDKTAPLNPLTRFHAPLQGPRDVNLQVTELRGSYRLVLFYDFGGTDFDLLSCTIRVTRGKIVELLKGVRKDLMSVVNIQGKMASGKPGSIFYDGEPSQKPEREGRLPHLFRVDDDVYEAALTLLARAGSKLYVNLFESAGATKQMAKQASLFGQRLRELSARQPLRIQVLSDEFFIPWNLLFDGPFPAERIDPDQFWGFRHTIEEVPGSSREDRIDPLMRVADDPFPIALNLNVNGIPTVLTDPQRSKLQSWKPALNPLERFTGKEVLTALQGKSGQGEVEYFYCHAGVDGTSDTYFDKSYLGLTSTQRGLTLEDIKIATVGREFARRPVVFLNACESALMDGRFYDGFVPRFLDMGARVVIGSDCKIPSLVGAHFGTGFLEAFFKAGAVGEAVLAQRRKLLAEYQNPLGLIYRVFGNGDTRLSKPLI